MQYTFKRLKSKSDSNHAFDPQAGIESVNQKMRFIRTALRIEPSKDKCDE